MDEGLEFRCLADESVFVSIVCQKLLFGESIDA
jgi:hypothetical protein